MKSITIIPLSTTFIILPLWLWRVIYPVSDWAVFALVALGVILVAGIFQYSSALFRARLTLAVRTSSPVAKFLTGRIQAGFVSVAFTVLAVPLLAWHALRATPEEMAGFVGLIAFSGALTVWVQNHLVAHLHLPFAYAAGVRGTAIVAGLAFIPILASLNWSFSIHPGDILAASLDEAIALSFAELPIRRGWIAEILAIFYALDAIKVWFVVQFETSRLASILFSLDSALISFIAAQTGATIANLLSRNIKETNK